eukprot:scaffold7738_cov107-Isochrysis_galbana.AAC.14
MEMAQPDSRAMIGKSAAQKTMEAAMRSRNRVTQLVLQQCVVAHLRIRCEAVEDATRRRRLEEGGGRAQHRVEQLDVQPLGGGDAEYHHRVHGPAVDGKRGDEGQADINRDPEAEVLRVGEAALDPVGQPHVREGGQSAVEAAQEDCNHHQLLATGCTDIRLKHLAIDGARLSLLELNQPRARVVLLGVAGCDHAAGGCCLDVHLFVTLGRGFRRRPRSGLRRGIRRRRGRRLRWCGVDRRRVLHQRDPDVFRSGHVLEKPTERREVAGMLRLPELVKVAAHHHRPGFDQDNVVSERQVLRLVRDQNTGLAGQQAVGPDDMLEQVLANVGIHGRERVVQ